MKFATWCTGERELYDLKADPYETNNLYGASGHDLDSTYDESFIDRLDALLYVLKDCKANSCRNPWEILHPGDKSIETLKDALHKKVYLCFWVYQSVWLTIFSFISLATFQYDSHYKTYRNAVGFYQCIKYYSAANEVFGAVNTNKTQTEFGKDAIAPQFAHPSKQKRAELDESRRLFNLLPRSAEVGHAVPDPDTLEASAQLIPRELHEAKIDWVKHGFYAAFGN